MFRVLTILAAVVAFAVTATPASAKMHLGLSSPRPIGHDWVNSSACPVA
jgi:hypothetical protein